MMDAPLFVAALVQSSAFAFDVIKYLGVPAGDGLARGLPQAMRHAAVP
jgi:hypothetical protein